MAIGPTQAPTTPMVAPGGRRVGIGPTHQHLILAVIGVAFLVSTVRAVTDTPDLTSIGTFEGALRAAVPIGLAGLGGLYAERAGVVNIGLEGMMILGTWFGAWAGWQWGPWWGLLAAVLGGAAGGLLHAVATVTFDVDHIVSGVAINILGAGMARFLSSLAYGPETGGGITQSPIVGGQLGTFSVPVLAGGQLFGWDSPDVLRWLATRRWLLVSDAAAVLHALTGNLSVLTIIALALIPLSVWFLWHTPLGLRLRSVGENPGAAESLGVPVYTMKYLGVVLSGALAGFAGAFIVLINSTNYKEGQTGGRGFIGLASMIFGNWRPTGAALGAGLFGYADALQLRSNDAIHSLLLFVAVLVAAITAVMVIRHRTMLAAILGTVATGFLVWYLVTDTVPAEIIYCTPYVVTLVVLASAGQRLRPPAADGLRYRKGQVH